MKAKKKKNPCGTNPKRKRKATPKRTRKANPAERIPDVVVYLGKALELGMSDDTSFKFRGSDLVSNVCGDRLYIIPSGKRKASKKTGRLVEKARKLFSKFTEFEADRNHAQDISDRKLEKIGTALFIVYRSDKWSGRTVDYIHEFEHTTTIHADNKTEPTLLLIRGKLAVKKEGITG